MKRPHRPSKSLQQLHTDSPYPVIKTAWERGISELNPSAAQLERGLELHSSVMAVDHFGFLPSIFSTELGEEWRTLRDARIGGREFHFELSLLRSRSKVGSPAALDEYLYALAASGLSGLIQTVAEGKTLDEDIKRIASFHGIRQKAHAHLAIAGSEPELIDAMNTGRFVMVPSVNGPPLPGALRDPREEFQWLQTWHDLGVRLMHLTYNRRNVVGDGCAESANAGISDLGRELIARMNALGIIVDLPHTGDQSCLDACAASSKPVMASHTGRKAFHDHMRCKSDAVLKAIAETGGLVGVVSLPSILGRDGNLNTLLDAVKDMTDLIGAEHVSIATDYSYQSKDPTGELVHGSLSGAEFKPGWWGIIKPGTFTSTSQDHFGGSLSWTNWPLFTVGLVVRGFSDDDIENILGSNFLRVLNANTP